jgi:predicted transcriptional regulator
MRTATKPLLEQTAADLMTDALILIPRDMSLPAAAHLLALHQITGAPVVDDDGLCVGVLSATDFVSAVEQGRPGSLRGCSAGYDFNRAWQMTEEDGLPRATVQDYMTANPVTVSADVPIAKLARMMVDAHIHRLLVVDETGHPRGIVSSTDILAALACVRPG